MSLSLSIFRKVRNSWLERVSILLLMISLTLTNLSLSNSFCLCMPSRNLMRQCSFISWRGKSMNLSSILRSNYWEQWLLLHSEQQTNATCLAFRYPICLPTSTYRHSQTSLSPLPSRPQLHTMSSNCSTVANLAMRRVDVLSMLRRAFSLNLKKQPEVDLRSSTKSVILSLSLAGQQLQRASSSFTWNLFDPKSWISKYELAFTNQPKLILGSTASMCFQARENTPQPPLAFSETLLSMQADSASSKGRSQCWPTVRVLLMWEQRTALPTLRWVQEYSIFLMRGKSIRILSSIMTFSTSFISYSSFLLSFANLQTISIS